MVCFCLQVALLVLLAMKPRGLVQSHKRFTLAQPTSCFDACGPTKKSRPGTPNRAAWGCAPSPTPGTQCDDAAGFDDVLQNHFYMLQAHACPQKTVPPSRAHTKSDEAPSGPKPYARARADLRVPQKQERTDDAEAKDSEASLAYGRMMQKKMRRMNTASWCSECYHQHCCRNDRSVWTDCSAGGLFTRNAKEYGAPPKCGVDCEYGNRYPVYCCRCKDFTKIALEHPDSDSESEVDSGFVSGEWELDEEDKVLTEVTSPFTAPNPRRILHLNL